MQKKIIALAVAGLIAAPAFAQSSVAISGYLSTGFANTRLSGSTSGLSNGTENSVIDSRLSRIRFNGSEDLGGGLKAIFQVESRFMADTSDATAGLGQMGVGDDYAGLAGNWGTLRIGRMDTYYADGIATEISRATTFQSHATLSLLTQVDGFNYIAGAGRWNNLIRYETPRMGGFQGSAAISTNRPAEDGPAANGANRGYSWYLAGNYMNGPVYAGLSMFRSPTEGNTTVKNSGYRLYGSYKLPFGLKFGLNYDHGKLGAVGNYTKRNAFFIPVSYTFGPNAIYFAYGQAGRNKTIAGTTPNTGARFWNFGYDYGLSRRTSVGVNYTMLKNKSGSAYDLLLGGVVKGLGQVQATVAGQDVRQLAFSINHAF